MGGLAGTRFGAASRTVGVCALVVLVTAVSAAGSEAALAPPDFADEFNSTGGHANSLRWGFDRPWRQGVAKRCQEGELECYEPEQVSVANGELRLTAEPALVPRDPYHPYSSGMIQSQPNPSKGRVGYSDRYGYVAVRAKLPAAEGVWPTLWLLPEDLSWPPEIDFMEAWGPTTDVHRCDVHWPDGHFGGPAHFGPDLSRGFHTYAVRWTRHKVQCIFDGRVWNKFTSHIPDKPMYILASVAVGGIAGAPKRSDYPAHLAIKWIRAWRSPCRCR